MCAGTVGICCFLRIMLSHLIEKIKGASTKMPLSPLAYSCFVLDLPLDDIEGRQGHNQQITPSRRNDCFSFFTVGKALLLKCHPNTSKILIL